MNCKDCGGEMIGDGYTMVYHCEYTDEHEYEFHEPDAGPIYCGFVDKKVSNEEAKRIWVENQRNGIWQPACDKPEFRTTAEIWVDFLKGGFQ